METRASSKKSLKTWKGFSVQSEAFFKRRRGPSTAAEEVTEIFSQMVLKIDGVLLRPLRLNSIPGSKIVDKMVCPCSPLVTFPKTPAECLQLSCCGHTDDPASPFQLMAISTYHVLRVCCFLV